MRELVTSHVASVPPRPGYVAFEPRAALAVQFSLRARLAHTAGAPTHTRTPPGGDSGLLHILGPAPEVDRA